jgi:hypothetical protein
MNKKHRKLKRRQQRPRTKSSPSRDENICIKPTGSSNRQKMPLWTITGELFQPVRIYYDVLKLQKILTVFHKLQCMDCDLLHEHWTWLYTGESRKITFEKRNLNPTKPLMLGSFCIRGERNMYLDVPSIERALEAIPFFDRYLSRRAAKITHLSVVNRLFDVSEARTFTFDHYVESNSVSEDPIKSALQTLDSLSAQVRDEQEKMTLIEAYLENNAREPFPEVEHLAVHYYQEGIHQPWLALGSRQYIAIQHWKGNPAYSYADYIREVVRSIGEIPV